MFLTLTVLSTGISAQDYTVETILEKYYSVNGKQEYMALKSITKEGYRIRNDIMPVKYYQMRPNKHMMIYDVADMTAFRTFDGEIAWYTAPWRGTIYPELFTEEQLEATISSFDFDPKLYTWEEQGDSIIYKGKVTIKDEEHFILELIDNQTHQKTLYFINSNTYFLTKSQSFSERDGKEVVNETIYSEYRQIDGIMFPFVEETFSNKIKVVSIEYDEIILNPKIEKDFFKIETHFKD